ncbi:hypothetical protein C8F04DRAFT_1203246 [Mycena alexandri]|uniref:Uncharacterized protein n=1 Tax=Mycena alexandri TaxID=1745969 RepID=A0AAD6RXI7_9AGAR|nr:hypothetical protein C8F04DRAFT_1203246 [Mycena alexandri]
MSAAFIQLTETDYLLGRLGIKSSAGKVRFGSGSGHFALNPEPEPGVRFSKVRFAFERVQNAKKSGDFGGLITDPGVKQCLKDSEMSNQHNSKIVQMNFEPWDSTVRAAVMQH